MVEHVSSYAQEIIPLVSISYRTRGTMPIPYIVSSNLSMDFLPIIPGQFPIEDMLKLTVYVLETATTRSLKTSNTHYFTAIWDCAGQGFRNLDTALVTHKPGIIHIMKVSYTSCVCMSKCGNLIMIMSVTSSLPSHNQEYYPECLQSLLIVNANWIFKAFWAIISPFLDERTKRKVSVLSK